MIYKFSKKAFTNSKDELININNRIIFIKKNCALVYNSIDLSIIEIDLYKRKDSFIQKTEDDISEITLNLKISNWFKIYSPDTLQKIIEDIKNVVNIVILE